jgi:hypothetical protein
MFKYTPLHSLFLFDFSLKQTFTANKTASQPTKRTDLGQTSPNINTRPSFQHTNPTGENNTF